VRVKQLFILGVVVLLLCSGAVFGSDQITGSAEDEEQLHLEGERPARIYSLPGVDVTWLSDYPAGFFAHSSAGLMEMADEALSEGMVLGDTLVGVRYQSEWAGAGFHFGAGVSGALESYRLGSADETGFSLGVGAVGGMSYYVTDSVALFLQLKTDYDLFWMPFGERSDGDPPKRTRSVLFQGGMAY